VICGLRPHRAIIESRTLSEVLFNSFAAREVA